MEKTTFKNWNSWCDARKADGALLRLGLPPRGTPPTFDCGGCGWNKNLAFGYPGVIVAGSYGKCCRPAGPCDNPKPRQAISRMGGGKRGER